MSDDRTPTRKPRPNYPAADAPRDPLVAQPDWNKVVVIDSAAGARTWESTYGFDAPSVPAEVEGQRNAELSAPGGGSTGTAPIRTTN